MIVVVHCGGNERLECDCGWNHNYCGWNLNCGGTEWLWLEPQLWLEPKLWRNGMVRMKDWDSMVVGTSGGNQVWFVN